MSLCEIIPIDALKFKFYVIAGDEVYGVINPFIEKKVNKILEVSSKTFSFFRRSVPGKFSAKFDISRENELIFRIEVSGLNRIHGIRFTISNLPVGKVILPLPGGCEVALQPDETIFASTEHVLSYYPGIKPAIWTAPIVIIEYEDHSIYIGCKDKSPRPKRIWITRKNNHLILSLCSLEKACEISDAYTSPEWFIKKVSSWREAVEDYRRFMENELGIIPFEKRKDVPDWAKKIALYVVAYLHNYTPFINFTFEEFKDKLTELATKFPPAHTLIYIAGWDGRPDMTYPHYKPSEELGGEKKFKEMIDYAHNLGFKIMLHFNLFSVCYNMREWALFKDHQIRDVEGRLLGWDADHNTDGINDNLMGYISLDYELWRKYLLDKIVNIVKLYDIDAVHLDQSACEFNDPHHDTYTGKYIFFEELKKLLPNILIEGEGVTDLTVSMTPFVHTWIFDPDFIHPMYTELFNPYIKHVGHMDMPNFGFKRLFWKIQEAYDKIGVIPSLPLNLPYPCTVGGIDPTEYANFSLDSKEARHIFEKAYSYLSLIA